ncbi:MAG: hypothetical protein GY757_37885, partial [bacterium]|nr:hypothetical protein [bacterium]
MKNRIYESGSIGRLVLLIFLAGLAASVAHLVKKTAPSSLELHFEDEAFHTNLEGEVVKITGHDGETVGTFVIKEREDGYRI